LSAVVTIVIFVTEASPTATWISEYNYPNRQVCLVLAHPGAVGHHWSGIRKAQSLSDPGGDFDVYVSHRPERDDAPTEDAPIVKIVAALTDEGDLKNPHPDFNTFSIGSPTIWPYKVAGERFGLSHWIWWVKDAVFSDGPRPWSEAVRDG